MAQLRGNYHLLLLVFLEILYQVNQARGYQWEITKSVDTKFVKFRCERENKTKEGAPGPYWIALWKTSPGKAKIFAEQKLDGGTSVANKHIEASGNLGRNGNMSFLDVRWPYVSVDSVGVYQCQVHSLNPAFESEYSGRVDVKYNGSKTNVKDIVKSWNQLKDDVKKCPDTERMDNKPNQGSFYTNLQGAIQEHESLIKQLVSGAIWFQGGYGLLMPDMGCPMLFKQTPSYITIHKESSSNKTCDTNTQATHLPKPLDVDEGCQCFLNLRFCDSEGGATHGDWPAGSYCINGGKSKKCPAGFSSSVLDIDYEDSETFQFEAGNFVSSGSIHFCCRNDGRADKEVAVPTGTPFYLYRSNGTCQQIKNMTVTEEFVAIDTEDEMNKDSLEGDGAKPDVDNIGSGQPIRLNLCYYSGQLIADLFYPLGPNLGI